MAGDAFFSARYDDADLRASLERARNLPADQRLALASAIGGIGVTSTVLRFDTQTAPDGARWLPSLRVQKDGGKTLQLHGYLIGSIVENPSPAGVDWGSPLRYAAPTQTGAIIRVYARSQQIYRNIVNGAIRGRFVRKAKANFASWATQGEHEIKIPARPFLGINTDDAANIEDVTANFMLRVLSGGAPA